MKKIFLLTYARTNLGDDLFMKIILEKFSNIDFYITVPDYKFIEKMDNKYDNLHVIIDEDTDSKLYEMDEELYDGYIYAGGSIFMEGGKVYNLSEKFYEFIKRCKRKNIPFFYISNNYGPYQTEEYFNLSRKNFKECTDICFRDIYSYDLFKDIATVRYAPDLVFCLELDKPEVIKDTVGISVIFRDEEFNKRYISFLKNNIENYLKLGKEVTLFSFCKHEGDEKMAYEVLELFDSPKVKVICYDGDIEKFIKEYSQMEYIMTDRFHSLVLSLIARQKIFVTSYSNKIDNIINDLKLDLPILRTENIYENDLVDLKEFKMISDATIKKISEEAKGQMSAIQKFLES